MSADSADSGAAAAEDTPATATATTLAPTSPEGGQRPPDSEIGPGIVGFVATFAVAVALVFLVRDMNRRIQRLRYGNRAGTGGTEGRAGGGAPDGGRGTAEAPAPDGPGDDRTG